MPYASRKVWHWIEGRKHVVTPVTAGKHPVPGKTSQTRVYGSGPSKTKALAALAALLGVTSDEIKVVALP